MNFFFIKLMPNFFVKIFAKAYIGGNSEENVLSKAKEQYIKNKFLATLDALGEDVKSQSDINKYFDIYLSMIKKVSENDIFTNEYERPSVSIKPSCFLISIKKPDGSLDTDKMDWNACYETMRKICSFAKEKNVRVTIDMEDKGFTDFTLDSYFKLLDEGFDNVGTVIQSMLFRSKEDVKRFNNKSRVRLVIGIYREPATVAFTNRNDMKDQLITLSKELLDRGVFLEFGTHDEFYIKRFFNEVIIPNKIDSSRYEVQFLLGVPLGNLDKKLISGEYLSKLLDEKEEKFENTKVYARFYLPFADNWNNALAYSKRRLSENPNIILYGLKNLLPKKEV